MSLGCSTSPTAPSWRQGDGQRALACQDSEVKDCDEPFLARETQLAASAGSGDPPVRGKPRLASRLTVHGEDGVVITSQMPGTSAPKARGRWAGPLGVRFAPIWAAPGSDEREPAARDASGGNLVQGARKVPMEYRVLHVSHCKDTSRARVTFTSGSGEGQLQVVRTALRPSPFALRLALRRKGLLERRLPHQRLRPGRRFRGLRRGPTIR